MAGENVATDGSVQEQYRAVEQASQAAQSRLDELRQKALTSMLTVNEEFEQLGLERRIANLAPQLETLRKASAYQETEDIAEQHLTAVDAMIPEGLQYFEDLNAAVADLVKAREAFVAWLWDRQRLNDGLPTKMKEKLSYRDPNAVQQDMANVFGVDLRLVHDLTKAQFATAVDAIPYFHKANRYAIARFLEEHKVWLARESQRESHRTEVH